MISRRNIEDILDSDDELPTEYIDLPSMPAYQDDCRFIEQKQKQKEELLEKVILEGMLSKKDILSFKCLEHTSNHTTLIWFFKYLMLKDLQAKYTYLNTCLIPDYKNYLLSETAKYKDGISEKLIKIRLEIEYSNKTSTW